MSVILQTMLAVGVDVSMKKGERASSLTWTSDSRVKKGLFAVSRLEVARKWMCAFCTAAM